MADIICIVMTNLCREDDSHQLYTPYTAFWNFDRTCRGVKSQLYDQCKYFDSAVMAGTTSYFAIGLC